MNKYTILIITFGLFLFGCGPHPEPEPVPEEKTIVGHTYVTTYVDTLSAEIFHWGYTFISDDTFVVIDYIDKEIIASDDTLKYNLNFPIIEWESGVQLKLSDDYSEMQEVEFAKRIFTRIE